VLGGRRIPRRASRRKGGCGRWRLRQHQLSADLENELSGLTRFHISRHTDPNAIRGIAMIANAIQRIAMRGGRIADRALARAWSALTAEQFAQFPSLSALLAYLRTCVGAAAIDAARAGLCAPAYQKLEPPSVTTPEELVIGAQSRDEVWKLLNKLVSNEHERIILIESFVLGLPPRSILERHQDRFADVPAIYCAKRNLLNRLERSRDLRRIYQNLRAA
jgi:hypothetical protein